MSAQVRGSDGRFAPRPWASYEVRRDGYCRWRTTDVDGDEIYVYVHQVVACVNNDPREVFAPGNHVHHIDGVRWHNSPENVEVRPDYEHCNYHMNGERFDD